MSSDNPISAGTEDKPHCTAVSIDWLTAAMFREHVVGDICFTYMRGGILYGYVDSTGKVWVQFIYEPRQQGSEDTLRLERGTEEERDADIIAKGLK